MVVGAAGESHVDARRLARYRPGMIPVSILTGYLGSGKTTLLGRLLKAPAFARTAVIINEFGEVGLDHDLVSASSESMIELSTGCLCCAVRGDLALTLGDLLARRDSGGVTPFERIVIETSGLADPAPILQLLMTDAGLAERLVLSGVITTVDAVHGLATLDREPEAAKQAAVADRLIVTKGDLAGGVPAALAIALRRLNPAAPLLTASCGEIDPARLFDCGLYDPATKTPDVLRWLGEASVEAPVPGPEPHTRDITTFTILRDQPIAAVALTLFLETLAEHCGRDLLRMKGIISLAEWPERPAVVHGVQHVFHPPTFLERWPSADRRSRLVFIGRGIPKGWVESLLAAIEEEVAEVAAN